MLAPFFELQVRDVVDILLVSILVYFSIVWIRRAQAALVAGGILVLAVLYVAARLIDLRLMTLILQGFFAALFLVVVVVFQEELRQFFERLAVLSLRRRKVKPHDGAFDILVRCLFEFSRDRIGALVVLPGRQPLQRHLEGGIKLNGELSLPLIKSLFDPHSPGHDGAVIVEGNRITRFAVHLPLSKNPTGVTGAGTRHSAALGLAELTDAVCLVVSEERGAISVAEHGQLRQLRSPQELGAAVEQFVTKRHPPIGRRAAVVRMFRENWLEKIGSLVLVVGVWYALVPGSRIVETPYSIPVTTINIPADFVLESIDPEEVEVTLSGPLRAFYLFDPSQLRVTVDTTLAEWGRRTFEITEQDVRYPKQLNLQGPEPSVVKISLKKKPAPPSPALSEQKP